MLMSSCTSGGCGAKLGPGELAPLLDRLKITQDEALLVGFDSRDDAAVYQISPDCAIIATLDFFSPMVDDAALFGRIAAANALSDVYAMGGVPRFALNMLCVPQAMDKAVLAAILQGGAEKLQEAGVPLAGGHSIYDREVKYGLSVTGTAPPNKILRNDTCRAGDALILTKPLGVGIVLAAHRAELAEAAHVTAATASMERLNKYAAEVFAKHPLSACTDVTGFGLLAHLLEMLKERVSARLDLAALPLLPGTFDYAAEYLLTAAGQRNRHFVEAQLGTAALSAVAAPLQELMLDPQTSGGLLCAVPKAQAAALLDELRRIEPGAAIIGEILPRGSAPILFQ
jgi:selenium donor protein